MQTKKKTIVYLHRYPIEYESVIYPAVRRIFDLLLKKYNVVYISFKPTTPINPQLRKGLIIKELPYTVDRKDAKDKWLKMLIWFKSIRKIKKIIKEVNADYIIHKEQLPFIPYSIAKTKIPTLLDIGDWWWTTLFGGNKIGLKFAEKIENFESKRWGKTDNIFVSVHSETEKKILIKRGMSPNRIRVINHPSSDEIYKPIDASDLRKKLGLEKSWVVAIHGIIHPSKGYNQVLDWWAEIVKKHPNWKLLIIGGTIGEQWCKDKIKSLGIENNTIMTGWVKDTVELNKYLNLADCLLVTRRNDLANQGLIPSSLFHSLSIGKPVLITGLPGLSEMVRDKKDGYSFKPDSYKSFLEKLEYIYSHPKESKKVGLSGIRRGKEIFDPEKCAKGFYNFIDEILNKNSNR